MAIEGRENWEKPESTGDTTLSVGISYLWSRLGHGLLHQRGVGVLGYGPVGKNDCDGIGIGIVARLDMVAGRKEGVESLNERGVTVKEDQDAFDDLGCVETSGKYV